MLSEQECAALIFHAGLSTAGQINDISGRGVGMDAVRRFLSQEGGSIAIHLLHEGDGKDFCQFYFDIYLPLHLFASQKKPAFDAVA